MNYSTARPENESAACVWSVESDQPAELSGFNTLLHRYTLQIGSKEIYDSLQNSWYHGSYRLAPVNNC